MKKIMLILALLSLTACMKPSAKETPLKEVMNEISKSIELENPVTEDLSEQKNSKKYGISTEAIVDGVAYYSTSEEKSDKIILVRAKTKEDIEKLEQALSAQLTAASSAWRDNPEESKKAENGVLKTKDDCVILAISDKTKEIEEIFDKNL